MGENNPMDFFRQLVKQIIMNMKVRITSSAVRLFINQPTPSQHTPKKPQYYLMMRAPQVSIGKSEDIKPLSQQDQGDEIRFDLVVPELSVHLLREGVVFPEFSNEKASEEDFPF